MTRSRRGSKIELVLTPCIQQTGEQGTDRGFSVVAALALVSAEEERSLPSLPPAHVSAARFGLHFFGPVRRFDAETSLPESRSFKGPQVKLRFRRRTSARMAKSAAT